MALENRRFGRTYRLHHSGEILFVRSVLLLLVTANVVRGSSILVTSMMDAIRSPESSVLTSATRRNIPKDAILHSHRRENLKSFILLSFVLPHKTASVV
jgi:hypothetical protein